MLTVKASMFHLQQSIILSVTRCEKNTALRSRKLSHFSTSERFSMLCHTFHICTFGTPSSYNQGQSLLYVYEQFKHSISSLHCFGSSVDLQNLMKFKGVP
jgi:hypothetical protein